MKIVFFDSGAGGLTVLHEALQLMPNEEYIYFGDTANTPYGTKSKKEIKKLVSEAINKLNKSYKIKALVVACNTATSVAIKSLRKKYDFPIIGMEPAVKVAVDKSKGNKILVCATDLTLGEKRLEKLIEKLNAKELVEQLSLQELVQFAENFDFNSNELDLYLKYKFSGINWSKFDSMVLGCTHFIYYKDIFKKYIPEHIQILDGNSGTVNNLSKRVRLSKKKKGKIKYIISGKKKGKRYCGAFMDFLG